MVNADLMARLQGSMPDFSRGQRAIASYIAEHYDKAAFMTANSLGAAVGVSESTVVRFAVRMGYDGYPALQNALQDMIRNRLTSVQRLESTGAAFSDGNILRTVMNDDLERLAATLAALDTEAFEAVVRETDNARRLYIVGMRSSASLAVFLGFHFRLLFEDVHIITTGGVHELCEQLIHVSEDDVVYGISFPRYSSGTVHALRYAKEKGAKIIAVTDSAMSPIVSCADHVLYARSDMASFVDSLVAPMSLLNALTVAVGMRRKENAAKIFEQLENVWDTCGVFEKMGENGQ